MKNIIKKWSVVFVLSLALAIILIDATLLNVSISALIRDFNTDIQSIQWIITAYSLTMAALTITGGRLGDLFGRKRMFIIGALTFALGSFIASISQNVTQMVIGWSIIEGIGAAMMMPATASLLVSTYSTKKDRAIAFGVWGGVAAASSAIGPLLGGWLTTNYSWRWGFRLNIIVALVFIAGAYFIKECRDKAEKAELDILGVFLSSLGLTSLVYGIIESSKYGWFRTDKAVSIFGQSVNLGGYSITPIAITLGAIFLMIFALWENRREKLGHTPLVSLQIFINRQFTAGMITMGIVALGQAGLIFSIPVFAQSVRGLDALHTGQVLLPMSLTALFVAPLGGFLSHKFFKPKRLVQFGLLSFFAGYIVLQNVITIDTTSQDFIPGLILLGLGMGLVMAQISNLTLSAVSVEQAGEASGVNNTFRQVGSTLGTAIIGAVLLSTMTASFTDNINSSMVIPEMMKQPVIDQLTSQGSQIEFNNPSTGAAASQSQSPVGIELNRVVKQSVTDSSKASLQYAAFFVLLGLLASTQLPTEEKQKA